MATRTTTIRTTQTMCVQFGILNKPFFQIGNSITKIEMQNLPQGIYFIKVIDTKNKEFKTFKIIKN